MEQPSNQIGKALADFKAAVAEAKEQGFTFDNANLNGTVDDNGKVVVGWNLNVVPKAEQSGEK